MQERGVVQGDRSPGCFAPATLRLLLAAVHGDRSGELVDDLGETGLRDVRVGAAIAAAFGPEVDSLASARPHELAVAWPARLAAGGRPAVALLWAAARRPEQVFRKLEARFAEDLERAAITAWLRA